MSHHVSDNFFLNTIHIGAIMVFLLTENKMAIL